MQNLGIRKRSHAQRHSWVHKPKYCISRQQCCWSGQWAQSTSWVWLQLKPRRSGAYQVELGCWVVVGWETLRRLGLGFQFAALLPLAVFLNPTCFCFLTWGAGMASTYLLVLFWGLGGLVRVECLHSPWHKADCLSVVERLVILSSATPNRVVCRGQQAFSG